MEGHRRGDPGHRARGVAVGIPHGGRSHWTLTDAVRFLNHGSFGACPRVVLEEQARLRAQMESEPVRFFVRELEPLADQARRRLAELVGASAEDLAFVRNATEGVNTVLKTLREGDIDEILVTNHGYNAIKNAVDDTAARIDAYVTVIELPWPIQGEYDVVSAIGARLGGRKQLLLIDHVTSPTGLVLPVEKISELAARHGVSLLIDGAHAPGMVPLQVEKLGADYYTGNCHKWLCAPKGVAFLWVKKALQKKISPLVVSHGRNSPRTDVSKFRLEFDWTGTHDPTPYLCLPKAIDFFENFGGLPRVMVANRDLAIEARQLLLDALKVDSSAPPTMLGSMATVTLPDGSSEPPQTPLYSDPLQDALLFKHGIEVPIAPFPAAPRRVLRISAQRYNSLDDYEALARALKSELLLSV